MYGDGDLERQGYFRWGDEPTALEPRPDRVFELDNIATVHELQLIKERVGTHGLGGESAAHRRLKLYVAHHPVEFGLSAIAEPHVEYRFQTGDRVDVMFENHLPDRTVVEIEVSGESNVCVGIHQAIKYRSLAGGGRGLSADGRACPRSLVVAYETDYRRAVDLADRYEVYRVGGAGTGAHARGVGRTRPTLMFVPGAPPPQQRLGCRSCGRGSGRPAVFWRLVGGWQVGFRVRGSLVKVRPSGAVAV